MNKKLSIIVGGVLTAAVMLASIGAIAVYAQSPTPAGPQGGSSNGMRGSHLGPTELAAAAQALGMTTTDLSAELKSGKTYRPLQPRRMSICKRWNKRSKPHGMRN